MTPSVPSGGDTEARQELRTIIERAIWDTAVVGWGLTSSGRDALVAKIADAVLDALGLEQVGWGGDHGGWLPFYVEPHDKSQSQPVYRLRVNGGAS